MDTRFGGDVELFQQAWSDRFTNGDGSEPTYSTVRRWVTGRTLPHKNELFRLAAILNLDPVALFDIPADRLWETVNKIIRSYWDKQFKQRTIGYLIEAFHPSPEWPPLNAVAFRDPPRWAFREFSHDLSLGSEFYAEFGLLTEEPDLKRHVWYFAYRRALPGIEAWIPYGVVIRTEADIRLVHSSGFVEVTPITEAEGPARVATYFGKGPAHFRVASMHDFQIIRQVTQYRSNRVHFPG